MKIQARLIDSRRTGQGIILVWEGANCIFLRSVCFFLIILSSYDKIARAAKFM